MKTLDHLSDLEIDAQVTMVVYNLHDWEYSDNMQQFYHCGVCGNETNNQPVINYCNSWADMGPIILDNNIVITPCMGANIGDATGYSEHQNPVISEFNDNSKALRAAAIVFLMMNGVNPE